MIGAAARSMMAVYVVAARVVSAVRGHCADLLVLWDLVEQLWQDRTFAVAAWGEFYGADVRGSRVHGQMYLAPLSTPPNTMLAGLSTRHRRET